MEIFELKFTNLDATPKVVKINCDKASLGNIAAWYGGYFSGDRYTIHLDGELLAKDKNGDIVSLASQNVGAK